MTTIKSIGRPECRAIRSTIKSSDVAALLEDLGLKLDIGNISYSGVEATIKLTVNVEGYDADRESLEQYGYRFGLSSKHYNSEFTSNGELFRLVGIQPRRPKFPIKAVRVSDGRPFKMTKHVVAQVLAS